MPFYEKGNRVVAAVLCQPVGHRTENPDVMYKSGRDVWAPELRARRPEITMLAPKAQSTVFPWREPRDLPR